MLVQTCVFCWDAADCHEIVRSADRSSVCADLNRGAHAQARTQNQQTEVMKQWNCLVSNILAECWGSSDCRFHTVHAPAFTHSSFAAPSNVSKKKSCWVTGCCAMKTFFVSSIILTFCWKTQLQNNSINLKACTTSTLNKNKLWVFYHHCGTILFVAGTNHKYMVWRFVVSCCIIGQQSERSIV